MNDGKKLEMKIETDRGFFSQAWEVIFKVNNVILPFFIAWAVWVTSEIYELRSFKNAGPRFTQTDANNLQLTVKQWTSENFMSITAKNELVTEMKVLQKTINDLKDIVSELKFRVIDENKKGYR